MTWNSSWPLGTVSVGANQSTGQQNTSYIETNLGKVAVGTNLNTTRDHFWAVDPSLDGRHRYINSVGFTTGGPPGVPDDPVIGAGMDGVLYLRQLTSTLSTAQQDVQPFYRNATQVMQLLGIRAMGVFNGGASSPSQADVVYSHNLALQSAVPPGIVRGGAGLYTVTFANALPSNSYLILGGAIRNDSTISTELLFEVSAATSLTNVKSTTRFKFMTRSDGGTAHDPLQAWFICFGG